MKIQPSHHERGMVASLIVLIFIGVIFSIVVARGRQVTNLNKSLLLTEKRQDTARKSWSGVATNQNK
ncbi:MAG: hypothetical protein JWN25_987 [Verrucomicrobiales bacterium]|nr:hypothetical protein [Verrucomicrobiales bacterium]